MASPRSPFFAHGGPMMIRQQCGFNLLEMLVVLALSLWAALLGVPSLLSWNGVTKVEAAASEVASALQKARQYAIQRNKNVAVKFLIGDSGDISWALYGDGDGDGVRNRDIDDGTDPELLPPRPMRRLGRMVFPGFPLGLPPRDPSDPRRRLGRLHDPIRFNNSDLASFSPLGTATPGTVYVTDGNRHLAATRISSRHGHIRIMIYDVESEKWR